MTCQSNDSTTRSSMHKPQADDDPNRKPEEEHPHVHFSSHPKIRRYPSHTTAWTDHKAAPEPFSTPKSLLQRKKLGYGDFLKTDRGAGINNRLTHPNSYQGGNKYASDPVYCRSSSHEGAVTTNSKVAGVPVQREALSFNQQEFPCLSPVKQQPKPVRTTSWSSVAGRGSSLSIKLENRSAQECSKHATFDMIPPPPLSEMPPSTFDKRQVSFKDGVGDIAELQENLSQSFPPSQESNMSHTTSASLSFSSNRPEYTPFDSFTTMSRSCLQNDIGTLLARYNRIDEAMERYKLSIEVATIDRDGLIVALEHLSSEMGLHNSTITSPVQKKCPKVTEAEGLAWFHQKLLKGDVAAAALVSSHYNSTNDLDDAKRLPKQSSPPPFQPAGFGGLVSPMSPVRRMRSASFGVDVMSSLSSNSFDHPKSSKNTIPSSCPVTAPYPAKQTVTLTDLKRSNSCNMPQQFTIQPPIDDDRPFPKPVALVDDMEIYACGGLTPLGLEYISDPLPVLGTALRKLVMECLSEDELSDFGMIGNICEASVTQRRKRMVAALLMDSAALIASKINLASLRYRRADELDEVLSMLKQALEDFDSVRQVVENDPLNSELLCHTNFMDVFGLLEIVGHLNVGTVFYKLNKVRDARTSFECAREKLEKKKELDDEVGRNNFEVDTNSSAFNNEQHPHGDNRSPSNEYLLIVIRSSVSRALLRLNDYRNAEKILKLIAHDNKPHRRNGARALHGAASHNFGGGYVRSDSFSVTTSAVNTAASAYHHNLERRYKWLSSVAELYLFGLVCEAKGETEDYKTAMTYYNRLLSEARKKFDHRHPIICSLLERRGAVLFEQRKLQCSMLSYLACLKILEHQQFTNNIAFHDADMARVLYAVARVLHDKEDYHDALHMYQRALVCQRSLVGDKPSLNVITTLCNISRVHHLSGEIDEALATNQEVLQLATQLVEGKMDHPFIIHRLKVEGNILIEAGRLEDAMTTFIDAARRCCEDGQNRMITTLMGGGSSSGNTQEDANAGDSSVLSMRSSAALAHIAFLHPAAPAG